MNTGRAAMTIAKLAFALFFLTTTAEKALAAGDVFDQFFRYTEKENKVFFQEMPGETVDPFTGTLRLVQTDLVLPGQAGLDLRIVRTYSSKIWGRSDLLDAEPLLADKEKSVLGWGWTFHMGRLLNPNATGVSGNCSGNFPTYLAPDGSSRTFYPVAGSSTVFLSKDYWRLEKNCAALSGNGICVWSTDGTRYEFSNNYYNQVFIGLVPVWPLSTIVDPHANRISVSYVQDSTGTVDTINDTYNRTISFAYSSGADGKRLTSMTANGNSYTYSYTSYSTFVGSRRFLTEVIPPTGPSYKYGYATSATVAQNQSALNSVTYPWGGTASYIYGTTNFFTGRDTVPFAVVTQRSLSGRGVTSGTWTYSYSSPGSGSSMHVTTIGRPDGRQDTYTFYGFGYVAGRNQTGSTWMVGLTQRVSLASGAEVETFSWDARSSAPLTTGAYYSAPVYSDNCGPYYVWDTAVYAPVMTQRTLSRDGTTYTTTYADFDAYGQALTVNETGQQSRATTWTYFYKPTDGSATLNLVRDRPLSQHVCIGSDCFDNAWTYNAPGYARDSETISSVKDSFGYDQYGNLATVTNALNQTLTLGGYVAGYGTPTSLDFNGAFTISRTISWEGWIKTQRDGRGYTTSYDYDAIGRLKTVTPPVGNATGYDYASDGSWSRLARASYSRTTNLDGLGRVVSTSDSEGIQTSQRWDSMGRAWFKSYPYDSSMVEVGEKLDFDGLGRAIKQTKAYRPASGVCDVTDACEVDHSYSQNCVTTTVHRGSGDNAVIARCSTSFGNPDEQRLTKVTDANSKVWQYTYNAYGKLKNVTAPLSKGNRAYGYNSKQFVTSEASSESGTVSYPSYNDIGQPLTRTDARSIAWTYGYSDPLSRLRTISYGSGSPDNVTKDYDNANNVHSMVSTNGGTFTYGYDEVHRVTSQTWVYGGHTYTTSYHYNSAGCLDSMTYPTGTTLTMTCDTANRVKSVILGSAAIANNVIYHPSGQVKGMAYGNSTSTTVTYDDRARVKTLIAAGVVDLHYDNYDGADNVKSFENRAVSNTLRTMTYDKLDRLETTTAQYLWGSAAYQYDELGNRTFKSPGGSVSINYTYDSSSRLTAASGPVDNLPASMTLAWSPAGRLASTSDGAAYLYDGLGRRVQKTASGQSTVYHYDVAGHVIAETLPNGTRVRDYIYLGNKLIAMDGCVEGAPPSCAAALQWYHTDTLGSVLARTNTSGNVVARFDYQQWGEQWTVPAVQGDRQYNGRVYDPGTGFHDYGARMYWPEIGRFISADSYGGSPSNPATFNRYAYVNNNPYKYIDPTGKWGKSVHYTATRDWAVAAGFSSAQAATLAQADNGTDAGGTGPMPWQDQSRHFNTASAGTDSRITWYNAEFEEAVTAGTFASLYRQMAQAHPNESFATEIQFWENSAMSSLGKALHSLQDIYAHSREYQKESGGVYYHDDPITDRERERPVAFQNTRMATEQALRLYKEKVASRVQNGNGD